LYISNYFQSSYGEASHSIALLLFAEHCYAQEYIRFTLPKDSVLTGNVCHSLRVIDMRKHKDSLGGLSIETADMTETKVVPEQPLDMMLTEYFDKISTGKKGANELLLVLYDFQLMKRVRNVGLGYFYFSGDFYMGKDGRYIMLDSVDSIYEIGMGKTATDKLLIHARHKVFEMLNTYAGRPINTAGATLTETDAKNRRERIKAQYPIYTSAFKRGIYYTVDQFLTNSPLDTTIVLEEEFSADRKRQYFFYYLNARGRKDKQIRVDDFFAIYDGSSWYIGGKERIKKMFYTDGEFIATRKKWGASIQHNGELIGGIVTGGLLGGGAGAAMGGASIKNARAKEGEQELVYYVCRFDPAQKKFIPFKRLE
jgi:hypothetical protein